MGLGGWLDSLDGREKRTKMPYWDVVRWTGCSFQF